MRVLVHVRHEHVREVAMLGDVQEVAEPLRPCDWAEARGGDQLLGIEWLDQVRQHGGNVVEPTALIRVAHQLQRCRFGRGDAKSAAGRVLLDDGRLLQILSRDELHAHLPAGDRAAIRLHHHLKALRSLMSRAVELGRAEKGHVVGLAEVFHQLRNELVCGEAPQPAVLRREDQIEPSVRIGDLVLRFQPAQRGARGEDGTSQGARRLLHREVVASGGGEVSNELRGATHGWTRYTQEVTFIVTFGKFWVLR